MNITIKGRPISKKNNRRNFKNISLPPKAYAPFETSALFQLLKVKAIKGKVKVDYIFYMKGKLDTDCDNMIAGINDILQKSGVIEDDKLIVAGSFQKIAGCEDWITELKINNIERIKND